MSFSVGLFYIFCTLVSTLPPFSICALHLGSSHSGLKPRSQESKTLWSVAWKTITTTEERIHWCWANMFANSNSGIWETTKINAQLKQLFLQTYSASWRNNTSQFVSCTIRPPEALIFSRTASAMLSTWPKPMNQVENLQTSLWYWIWFGMVYMIWLHQTKVYPWVPRTLAKMKTLLWKTVCKRIRLQPKHIKDHVYHFLHKEVNL